MQKNFNRPSKKISELSKAGLVGHILEVSFRKLVRRPIHNINHALTIDDSGVDLLAFWGSAAYLIYLMNETKVDYAVSIIISWVLPFDVYM